MSLFYHFKKTETVLDVPPIVGVSPDSGASPTGETDTDT